LKGVFTPLEIVPRGGGIAFKVAYEPLPLAKPSTNFPLLQRGIEGDFGFEEVASAFTADEFF